MAPDALTVVWMHLKSTGRDVPIFAELVRNERRHVTFARDTVWSR